MRSLKATHLEVVRSHCLFLHKSNLVLLYLIVVYKLHVEMGVSFSRIISNTALSAAVNIISNFV